MAANELTGMDHQIAVTTNASVAASRRIAGIAAETEQLGVTTITKLVEQGDQLEHIGESVQEIGVDIRYAKYESSKLEFCGCCHRCCYHSKAAKQLDDRPVAQESEVVTTQPKAVKYNSDGPMIKYVLNDDREVEIDQNLRETGQILNNLNEIARDIGQELDRQNDLIPHITGQAENTGEEIEQVTRQLKKKL